MAISGDPPGCVASNASQWPSRRDPRVRHLAGRSRQQWTLRAIVHVEDEKRVEARAEGFDARASLHRATAWTAATVVANEPRLSRRDARQEQGARTGGPGTMAL